MNPIHASKINWTALVTQVITIAFLAGLIPMKYMTAVVAVIGIVMPTVVQVFRTWFTGLK